MLLHCETNISAVVKGGDIRSGNQVNEMAQCVKPLAYKPDNRRSTPKDLHGGRGEPTGCTLTSTCIQCHLCSTLKWSDKSACNLKSKKPRIKTYLCPLSWIHDQSFKILKPQIFSNMTMSGIIWFIGIQEEKWDKIHRVLRNYLRLVITLPM